MRAKTVAWQSVLGIPSEVDGSPDIRLLVRRSHYRAIVPQIPFPPGLGLVIADSGRNRELASGKYNSRREETQTSARVIGCVRFAMLPCHSWRPIPVCRNKYVVECGTSLKKKIASGARWSFWKTAMAPDSGN